MSRFADIDCSFKRLSPVYGFHGEKLVSIDTALEPIESQIEKLSKYIKIAKKHCHYPNEHKLSKDQAASIYIYTMEWGDQTLYRVLNRALRSENRQALKIWFLYLRLFDSALDLLPTIRGAVWRGVPEDIGNNFTRNQVFTWWAVSSCSSSVNVIEQFLQKKSNSTLFLIEVVNGKKISGYTEYENEDEIILKMGTEFCVKADPLKRPDGSHTVHLSEISDKDDDHNDQHQTQSPKIHSNPMMPPTVKYTSIANNQPYTQLYQETSSPTISTAIVYLPQKSTAVGYQSAASTNSHVQYNASSYPSASIDSNASNNSYHASLDTIVTTEETRSCCPSTRDTGIFILLCLLLLIPSGTFIIGMLYRNECPIQTWIPTWLIVFGAVGLVAGSIFIFIFILTCCCCRGESCNEIAPIFHGCIAILVLFFFLAWLITGSIWTFPIYSKVQYNSPTNVTYCNKIMYKTIFGTLIGQYSLIGLFVCLLSCAACMSLCID